MTPPHGTISRYTGGGRGNSCSCDACRAAWRTYRAAYRARLRAVGLPEGDRRHGTSSGYRDYGCRCLRCTVATRTTGGAPTGRPTLAALMHTGHQDDPAGRPPASTTSTPGGTPR